MHRVGPNGWQAKVAAAIVCGLLLLGCGSKEEPPTPVPVQGKVLSQGEPVAGVVVTFWPEAEKRSAMRTPTERNGTFRLSVPAGAYKVTIVPIPASAAPPGMSTALAEVVQTAPPEIASRYQHTVETPLRVSVPESGAANVVLKLQP